MQGMKARCPTHGVSCSTAYNRHHRCRCNTCREWAVERVRRWCASNPEKHREARRRQYAANPEKALERWRRWRKANLEKARTYPREYNRRLRAAVIAFLGGACERCGSLRNLDVHHRNGDGAEHRKQTGGFQGAWLEILSGAYPREAVELLCHKGCHGSAHRRVGG